MNGEGQPKEKSARLKVKVKLSDSIIGTDEWDYVKTDLSNKSTQREGRSRLSQGDKTPKLRKRYKRISRKGSLKLAKYEKAKKQRKHMSNSFGVPFYIPSRKSSQSRAHKSDHLEWAYQSDTNVV